MKKLFAAFLILSICLYLPACKQTSAPKGETVPSSEVEITTIATTTEIETTSPPTTEPPEDIHWTEEYYVDDFGDPTDESYIRGVFEGKFSNSATSGSDLTVCFFMPKHLDSASYDMFSIRLLEYGNHKASFIGCDYLDVTIKVKVDGEVYEDHPDYLFDDDGEIAIERGNKVFKAILDALDADKEISFVITVDGYGTDTYRFNVDANGLSDITHSWRGSF